MDDKKLFSRKTLYMRKWREKNREHWNRYMAEWHKKHPNWNKERLKRYDEAHPGVRTKRRNEWRAAHPGLDRQRGRQRQHANPKKYSEYARRRRKENVERHRTIQRRWRMENRERINARAREHCRKLKLEVMAHYGGKCACCGVTDIEFLTIDHVNGDGKEERARLFKKRGGKQFYHWLKRNKFPADRYRALCMNCNWSRGQYGYCPHETSGRMAP